MSKSDADDDIEDDEVWLDRAQQESWREVIGLLTTLPQALESDLRRGAGVTMFDYTVLASLSEAPGWSMQMSDLAYRANASLSRLSHVVSRLESRGFLTRELSGSDARATNAILTGAGWRKVEATAPLHAQSVRDLVVSALTPAQLKQFGILAGKLVRHIEARTAAP